MSLKRKKMIKQNNEVSFVSREKEKEKKRKP